MPGTLYVVATPIGNLEDVTLRALRVLREVSLIAAEDTRRTARLLQHYSISTRTTSLHEHNERSKTAALVARLVAGESIALVSDAGTPVVSDPGTLLVAAAHAAGVRVEPIPGASAALAVLSASGFPGGAFVFAGFPPNRSKARLAWFAAMATEARPLIFYEAPHRIRQTLADMLTVFGDRQLAIGREVTKAHENLVVRPITAHLAYLEEERGEFTLVMLGIPALAIEVPTPEPAAVAIEFGHLANNNALSRRENIRTLASRYRVSTKEIFNLLEQAKNSAE